MNARSRCGLALFVLCLAAAPSWAQEPGDKGITISAPSAIGFIWHLSPRVAIRPEVSFSFGGVDGEGSTPDLSSHSFSLGAGALFYTGHWDNLRTYVSPRLSYHWNSSSYESGMTTIDTTNDAWSFAGSFGAQYSLGTRFAVFGEAGVQYGTATSEAPSVFGSVERTTWSFGTRTQLGVNFYF